MRRTKAQGFTLVEVLISIVLLGIIVLAVLAPLTGFFGLTGRSARQVDATARAQQAVEYIRGQWLTQDNYKKACVAAALPSGVATPTVKTLNYAGAETGTDNFSTNCASATPLDAPIKRLAVTATVNGATSTLTLDIASNQ